MESRSSRRSELEKILSDERSFCLRVKAEVLKKAMEEEPSFNESTEDLKATLEFYKRRQPEIDRKVQSIIAEKTKQLIPGFDFDLPSFSVAAVFLLPPLYPLFEYLNRLLDDCEKDYESIGCCCVSIVLIGIVFLYAILKIIKKECLEQK